MSRKHHAEHELAGQEHGFGFYVPRSYWKSRLAPYALEWAAVPAGWLVTLGTHLWLGDSPALPWIAVLLTALGAVLVSLTWVAGRPRGAMTRKHATITATAAAIWLIAGTIAAPWEQVLLVLYLFGSAALAASWNIRRALSAGKDEDGGNLFEKVKLAGVKAREVEAAPNKVTANLQLPAGEMTVEDVQKAGDKLTGALRLHKGAVRVTEHPDDLSRATMTIVPNDVLRTPQAWPGPSNPGGSIAEGITVGLYEDNEPVHIFFSGDKATQRQASHYQVVGMNGSGKTHGAKLAWTDISTRRDAALIVLDPAKGEQAVGFLGHDTAHVVTGQRTCQEFVKRVPAAIEERATQLGRWGFDEWTPEAFECHGMPYVVLWIEEATRVLTDAATITTIAEAARSAGVSLVLSLQRATFRRMSTDVRAQLGGAWCFGVRELEDAGFSLSDDLLDAGAHPERWQNRRPGCHYLEAPGIEEERHIVPGRTFNSTDSELIEANQNAAHVRPGLDALTANALQLPKQPSAPAEQEEAAMTTAPVDHVELDEDDLDAMPLNENDDVLDVPDDPEPDIEADADTELPDDPNLDLPAGRPTRKEARARLFQLLEQLADNGRTKVTVRDLPDAEQTFGRTRQWVSGELARFARDGYLSHLGEHAHASVYALPARDMRNAA